MLRCIRYDHCPQGCPISHLCMRQSSEMLRHNRCLQNVASRPQPIHDLTRTAGDPMTFNRRFREGIVTRKRARAQHDLPKRISKKPSTSSQHKRPLFHSTERDRAVASENVNPNASLPSRLRYFSNSLQIVLSYFASRTNRSNRIPLSPLPNTASSKYGPQTVSG